MSDLDFNGDSLLPSRAKSAIFLRQPRNYEDLLQSNSFSKKTYNNDEDYFTPRREAHNTFGSDSLQSDMGNLSAHDIVRARNTSERINDLEKTNFKLRRMLKYGSIDKLNAPDSARLVQTDRSIRANLLGPPILRQGRIGSSWRHIRQTNNYSNNNLLFIDGTVRIDDSARFPPRLYGYPPKQSKAVTHRDPVELDHEMIGLNSKSLSNLELPINSIVKNRPLNLNPYENKFQQRAKEGFEYWTKDKRYPENNKPKAKLYTTGAYKTFHGLSDSLLKT